MKEYADREYSEKLAELFPDAQMWWTKFPKVYSQNEEEVIEWDYDLRKKIGFTVQYPAITIAMALDVLPEDLTINDNWGHINISFDKEYGWIVNYQNRMPTIIPISDKSLPNALCLLIIKLKEEGYYDSEETL